MTKPLRSALCAVFFLHACGGDSPPPTGEHAGLTDAGHVHGHEDEDDSFMGCPDTIPPFALGMQAIGESGRLRATLLDASNVPPRRYLNDWTLALSAADGSPRSDIVLKKARPWMPVHGHDGIVIPVVEPLAEPGHVRVRGFNLNMRGPWEIQLTLGSASAGDDYVVFHICVEE